MERGTRKLKRAIARRDPIAVSITALWPCPFIKSSCPGSVESPVSSSGAPRNMEGMKSMNVWVIAIAMMKTNIAVTGRLERIVDERIIAAIRLI